MAQPNMFGVTEFDQDPETAAELMRILRQQQIADAMMQSGRVAPQGRMAGRIFVPSSPLESLGALAEQYVAKGQMGDVEKSYGGLASRKAQETADAIAAYKRGTMGSPEQPMGPPTEEGSMGVQPAITPSPDQRRQAIIEAAVSSNPRLSKMGQMDFQMDARKEDKAAAREDKLFQIQMAHQNNLEKIKADALERRITREEADRRANESKEQMVRLAAGLRQPRDEGAPVAVIGPDGKPMLVSRKDSIGKMPAPTGKQSGTNVQLPHQALKLQQEELDAIGTGSSIKKDIDSIAGQVERGEINPSLVNNAEAWIRDKTNTSTSESRNFLSFKATLEKLRNDSLRLNKGVQTEGDSQRAWDELLANVTDKEYVKKRLKEISDINDRAVSLRKMNVDVIRNNYGVEPLDVSGYQNVPAAVGKGDQGLPKKVASDADYSALPSGAIFIDPQGNQRRKP
jgi:hypothetical protein